MPAPRQTGFSGLELPSFRVDTDIMNESSTTGCGCECGQACPSRSAQASAQPSPEDPVSVSVSASAPANRPGVRLARRMLFVLAGAAVFLGVASVIKPAPRQAAATIPTAVPLVLPASSLGPHDKGWKLLGTLQGKTLIVRAFASPDGPRYSVYSTLGQLLQADLPADEVYRAFPQVDLQNIRLEPGVTSDALMLHPGIVGD